METAGLTPDVAAQSLEQPGPDFLMPWQWRRRHQQLAVDDLVAIAVVRQSADHVGEVEAGGAHPDISAPARRGGKARYARPVATEERTNGSSSPSRSACQLASMMFSEHPMVLHRSAPRADSRSTRGLAAVPRCSSTMRTL